MLIPIEHPLANLIQDFLHISTAKRYITTIFPITRWDTGVKNIPNHQFGLGERHSTVD